MTQPAAPEKSAEMPPATPEAPPEPTLDLTKGWEAESYRWPDDAPADGAPPADASTAAPPVDTPPSPAAPAAPASAEAPPAPSAEDTKLLEAIVGKELSPDEVETLLKNPRLKARVEQLANNRFGNLKAEEDKRRQKEAAAEQAWAESEDFYHRLEDLKRTDRAEYDKTIDDPEVKIWLGQFEQARAARAKAPAAIDVDRVRSEVLAETLPEWNVAAAKAFGATVAKEVTFYKDLPADLRRDLEAGTQSSNEQSWAEEYMQRITKGFMSWHNAELEAAREAGRNEARADGNGASPVMVAAPAGTELSADQILQRYMDYGNDPDRGVTEEQYFRAKKSKGWE